MVRRSSSSALTDTLNLSLPGNGNRGDMITVTVTPNDGTVNGTAVSDTATVANTAPVASNVLLSDTTPTTNQTISVSHDYGDADGDAESGTTYQWQINTGSGFVNIAGPTSSSLDLSLAGNGNKGDQLRVLVTPKDGTGFGTGVLSNVRHRGQHGPGRHGRSQHGQPADQRHPDRDRHQDRRRRRHGHPDLRLEERRHRADDGGLEQPDRHPQPGNGDLRLPPTSSSNRTPVTAVPSAEASSWPTRQRSRRETFAQDLNLRRTAYSMAGRDKA